MAVWIENGRLQLRGQLRNWAGWPAPHSRFTLLEGTDDVSFKAQCRPEFKCRESIRQAPVGGPQIKTGLHTWKLIAFRLNDTRLGSRVVCEHKRRRV